MGQALSDGVILCARANIFLERKNSTILINFLSEILDPPLLCISSANSIDMQLYVYFNFLILSVSACIFLVSSSSLVNVTCVGWDVKHYTIQHNSLSTECTDCVERVNQ